MDFSFVIMEVANFFRDICMIEITIFGINIEVWRLYVWSGLFVIFVSWLRSRLDM